MAGEWARAELNRRKNDILAPIRQDINKFAERVLKDEDGNRIRQAEIHRSWHEHIEYSYNIGKLPCIIAPWGHGKTQQIVIARTLWEIGHNQNIRIKIVCNDDGNAQARVRAIARYIEQDEDYQSVFPQVRPATRERWTQHSIFVQRTSTAHAIDPTVEAKGVLATGIGGRCDGIIFDDIVDQRNTLDEPALQPKVIESFKSVWLSRLAPKGWVLYVATRWTESDCTAHLLNDPELARGYCFLIQRITEDFSGIECERIG